MKQPSARWNAHNMLLASRKNLCPHPCKRRWFHTASGHWPCHPPRIILISHNCLNSLIDYPGASSIPTVLQQVFRTLESSTLTRWQELTGALFCYDPWNGIYDKPEWRSENEWHRIPENNGTESQMVSTATLHHDDVSVKKHFAPDLISADCYAASQFPAILITIIITKGKPQWIKSQMKNLFFSIYDRHTDCCSDCTGSCFILSLNHLVTLQQKYTLSKTVEEISTDANTLISQADQLDELREQESSVKAATGETSPAQSESAEPSSESEQQNGTLSPSLQQHIYRQHWFQHGQSPETGTVPAAGW